MVRSEPFNGVQELVGPFVRRAEQGAKQDMAREMLLRVLHRRFGAVPKETERRVQLADVAWCQEMVERAAVADSLAELGIA